MPKMPLVIWCSLIEEWTILKGKLLCPGAQHEQPKSLLNSQFIFFVSLFQLPYVLLFIVAATLRFARHEATRRDATCACYQQQQQLCSTTLLSR